MFAPGQLACIVTTSSELVMAAYTIQSGSLLYQFSLRMITLGGNAYPVTLGPDGLRHVDGFLENLSAATPEGAAAFGFLSLDSYGSLRHALTCGGILAMGAFYLAGAAPVVGYIGLGLLAGALISKITVRPRSRATAIRRSPIQRRVSSPARAS